MNLPLRSISLLLSGILVCGLLTPAYSQGLGSRVFTTVAPESVDLDSEKLAEINTLMSKEVDEGRIAGCLGLVYRDGKVAYFNMWGDQNRESKIPISEETIFRIYSMSKPITSVAVMQLVEREKVKLDDPAHQYLPALKNVRVLLDDGTEVEPNRPISVRDLLRHTSGLTYGIFGNTEVDQRYKNAGILYLESTIEETVEKLGKIPLLHQPGTRWHYSVSTDVLGRLVEVASGQRFDEYLKEHIFVPLGMVDTGFMVPREKRDRFAQMYSPQEAGQLKPANPFQSLRFLNPRNKYFSGGGGLCSTTADYLRFARALLNGGELDGRRIIKQETLVQMTTNQLTGEAKSGPFKFGLGFAISPEGEFSWGGAAGTRFWVNPKRNMITMFMIQILPYRGNYGGKMKKIVFEADKRFGEAAAAATAPMP